MIMTMLPPASDRIHLFVDHKTNQRERILLDKEKKEVQRPTQTMRVDVRAEHPKVRADNEKVTIV
jgi:hypothetical protein